jgi:hypothetical protein
MSPPGILIYIALGWIVIILYTISVKYCDDPADHVIFGRWRTSQGWCTCSERGSTWKLPPGSTYSLLHDVMFPIKPYNAYYTTTKVVSTNPVHGEVYSTILCDKVCQWLATGRWFSPGTAVSSTNKTSRHDIIEILLKVVLSTIILPTNHIILGNGIKGWFVIFIKCKWIIYFTRMYVYKCLRLAETSIFFEFRVYTVTISYRRSTRNRYQENYILLSDRI